MSALTRYLAASTLLTLTTLGAASAQEPPAPSRPPGSTTTIVGCLVQQPSPKPDEYFVRTPAIVVPAGAPVTVGESAGSSRATTSAGTPAATTLYRVTGLSAAELKPHLNHRIEVQGRLSRNTPPATTATTTQDPKTGRATTAVKDDWTIAGVVEAVTIKMIAASCQ